MRHIIPISGKDSLATAILQTTLHPEHNYEYVFNPTGAELPEVFEWMDRVQDYLGKEIVHVGRNLENIIASYNYFLPNGRARYCTRESKIEPFINWVGTDTAYAYYGIRADEQREGFNNSRFPNIIPVMPLIEHKIDISGVYLIIKSKGLKPPTFFWKSIFYEVCKRLNFDVSTILSEYEFDLLFAGRSRANCFMCFNQRLYELVWMLEVHPELFDKMEWYEYQGGEAEYHWKNGYPMKLIRESAIKIKEKRIRAICKYIQKKFQLRLELSFDDSTDEQEEFIDVLSVKSCGLFCGK